MKFKDIQTEEKVRLDPKCWTGKKIGNPKTKMKGGVRVNNCVPAESVEEAANPAQQAAIAIAKKKEAGKQGVSEMDKSQTPPGRDGHVSHSTYGSRDKKDPDAGKKQYYGKMERPEKTIKTASDILNKAFNNTSKKQGVSEAGQYSNEPDEDPDYERGTTSDQGFGGRELDDTEDDWDEYIKHKQGVAEAFTYPQKHSSWSVHSPKKNEFNTRYKLDQEKEARAHAERIGGKLVKIDQRGAPIKKGSKGDKGVAEGFNGEYDDEAGMAQGNLYTIAKAAQGLIDNIDDHDNLPEWCQEKIAKVEGMLVSVWNYLQSQKAQGIDPEIEEMYEAMDQLAEEMAHKNRVSVDAVWESFEAMDDHMLYETAAWRRKEGKSKTGGLNAKGVASYRRENPGSKLQTAVTTKPSKLKKGSKAAKRRKSFCARMSGVKGPMKKPNGKPTRKALALRKWNC